MLRRIRVENISAFDQGETFALLQPYYNLLTALKQAGGFGRLRLTGYLALAILAEVGQSQLRSLTRRTHRTTLGPAPSMVRIALRRHRRAMLFTPPDPIPARTDSPRTPHA